MGKGKIRRILINKSIHSLSPRDDIDDAALGLTIDPPLDEDEIHRFMHNILRSRTSDGLIPLHANNIWQPRIGMYSLFFFLRVI